MPASNELRTRSVLLGGALVASGMLTVLSSVFVTFNEEAGGRVGQIETPGGTVIVEIADTPAARSAGLSNRDGTGSIDGLLLRWDNAGRHPIWMTGMRFSLDLVWIDREGRVLAVLTNVAPCVVQPCQLYEPTGTSHSIAVLELPAGGAASRQLAAGTTVRFRIPTNNRADRPLGLPGTDRVTWDD